SYSRNEHKSRTKSPDSRGRGGQPMSDLVSRRRLLKTLGCASAGALIGSRAARPDQVLITKRPVEIQVTQVSKLTVRVSLAPLENGSATPIPNDGSLVENKRPLPTTRLTNLASMQTVRCGDLRVKLSPDQLTILVETNDGRQIQRLRIDQQTGSMTFP